MSGRSSSTIRAEANEPKNGSAYSPPGAGKTTRVPSALLSAAFAAQGEILVLQPRRIAARASSR